jgi:signal transduction histidine kinase
VPRRNSQRFYDDRHFWRAQIHPDDVARVLAELSTIQHGEPVSYEYRFRHADGRYVWLHDKVVPSRDSDGSVSGLVGSWFDVTARKQAEEERERLESQLRQSQKLQAIGQLAAGVAHDFNSLLMVMLGNIELMLGRRKRGKGGDADSPDKPALEQMLEAVERGRTLVQKLLAFGRTQRAKPRILDLNRIIADMDAMLRGLLDKNVKLRTRRARDLKHIRADAGQMEQAIMNLVINARDAIPGGGTLGIETANVLLDEAYAAKHTEARPGAYVLLAIRDTGHGMSKVTLERLFEPFFSTKPVDKGTGLGLSIVHGIVKQAGGHIEVTSKLGKGSVFKLYFPAFD